MQISLLLIWFSLQKFATFFASFCEARLRLCCDSYRENRCQLSLQFGCAYTVLGGGGGFTELSHARGFQNEY